MCVIVLPEHMQMDALCARCPQRTEESVRLPKLDLQETVSHRVLGTKPGTLQDQRVCLSTVSPACSSHLKDEETEKHQAKFA